MPKIALLPSNQHTNTFAGLPGVTEETWAVKATRACQDELQRHGMTVQTFHVAGSGEKSTDELAVMIQQAIAWNPDLMLSIHSDYAGGVADIFPQIGCEADRPWATSCGRLLAERLGMPFQACAVRSGDLMYFYKTATWAVPPKRRFLHEIGRWNTLADAAFAWRYAQYEGIQAARTFLIGTGLPLVSDGRLSEGVEVPPGQEKWAYQEEVTMSRDEYDALLAQVRHADMAASQGTYDNRIGVRLAMKDYALAVALNNAFISRWPKDTPPLPKDITAEELKAQVEG